ncbi:class I SAM-dependent methyltransferase [Kordiimonas aquimaris]|uniref:class I SAM-dependent methyltransferase n=1 Tax=Kordiimonas aquimaris TaxID=707591 RepID=UPI0021CF6F90|nr:methyltransferase domain-containing protein [Kordiimonas aquimaris]
MKLKYKSMIGGAAVLASVAASAIAMSVPAVADHHGHIVAAVNNDARPEQEVARDVNRKPTDVLLFAGVKPGMTVLDINSAAGYYTEILSHAVGDEGKVYAHNGAVYWAFMQKKAPARFEQRLKNVVPVNEDSESVNLPENSVDLVMSVLAYHDYFFNHEARKQPEDMNAVLTSIYNSLKPGGAFVVIDHQAEDGTGSEMGDKLHRINSEFVKEQVASVGFKVDSESDILANPEDNGTTSPFSPELRGKTDRYIIKFVK